MDAGPGEPPSQAGREQVDGRPDRPRRPLRGVRTAGTARSTRQLDRQLQDDPGHRRPQVRVLVGVQVRHRDARGPDPVQLRGELPAHVVGVEPARRAPPHDRPVARAGTRPADRPGWESPARTAAADPPRRWPDARRRRAPGWSAQHPGGAGRTTGPPPAATSTSRPRGHGPAARPGTPRRSARSRRPTPPAGGHGPAAGGDAAFSSPRSRAISPSICPDHRERGQGRHPAGAGEVVDADLHDGEPGLLRPDHQLGVDERPLAGQRDGRSSTRRRHSLNAKLMSRSRVPKDSWISQL